MDRIEPRKPLCALCQLNDSVTFCIPHSLYICASCASLHQGPKCFFQAAMASFLIAPAEQLAFRFEGQP